MRWGYAQGYRDGVAAQERALAILREELGRKERERAEAVARADRLTDQVLLSRGARLVSTPGLDAERVAVDRAADALTESAQMFEELAPDDPRGWYGADDLGPDLLDGGPDGRA